MATEKLKFKLELYATMWDQTTACGDLINDKSYFKGDITGTEDKPNVIEFEHELKRSKDYELIIKRSGKSKNQTVVNDKGDLLKDQLLHIKSIEIDEIDIGALVYEGVTRQNTQNHGPHSKEKQVRVTGIIQECHSMGHNGTWQFKFDITVLHVAFREPLLINMLI